MNKRFAVAISSSTHEQELAFYQWVNGRFSWWHWVANFWLIADTSGELTAYSVRDKVNECFPGAQTFVIELRDGGGETFAGSVESSQAEKAQEWLNQWWLR
jgi:hypothetical protein